MGQGAPRASLQRGMFVAFSRSVIVDSRRATTFRTRAAAALLYGGPDTALSGHSSLYLHGCTAAEHAPVHIITPYHRKVRSRDGVVVHSGAASESEVVVPDGMRSQRLEIALAEVLCRSSGRSEIACADQVLGMVAERERGRFRGLIEDAIRNRPDLRGTLRAGFVLGLASGLAESPPESWTLLAMVEAGLPLPTQQFPIHDLAGKEIYRLDFAWPEFRVAVEYDGYEAHEGRRGRDKARDLDLKRRGWTVIRADSADLKDPRRLTDTVRAALRARGMHA
jgi:hypothetical protein